MTRSEHQDRQETQLAELDRRAWSLPTAPVVPAGPVREIWPVRHVPAKDFGSGFFDALDDEAV